MLSETAGLLPNVQCSLVLVDALGVGVVPVREAVAARAMSTDTAAVAVFPACAREGGAGARARDCGTGYRAWRSLEGEGAVVGVGGCGDGWDDGVCVGRYVGGDKWRGVRVQ